MASRQLRPITPSFFWAAVAGFCVVIVFLPFVGVPFLQDDFVLLYRATLQIESGHWLAWAGNPGGATFWRPITMGLYWTFAATVLQGSSVAAHIINIILLGCTAVAAGLLGCALAEGEGAERIGPRSRFWAVFLFGIHGCWLLPVVWACAVQETIACLFSTLSLFAFVKLAKPGAVSDPAFRPRDLCLTTASVGFFVLALLSKEGTVIVPLLAGILVWGLRLKKNKKLTILAISAGVIMVLWAVVRIHFTRVARDSPYSLEFGLNVVRNIISLFLLLFNFPREAMVGWLVSRSGPMLSWGIACFALQACAVYGFLRMAGTRFPRRTAVIWIIAALLPYLLLKSQSYPYYACIALLTYPWLIARAAASKQRGFAVAVSLAIASSLCLYCTEPLLSRPAPIARAFRAERALQDLVPYASRFHDQIIALEVVDEPSYAAGGYSAGPAMVLKIDQHQLLNVAEIADESAIPVGAPTLQVDETGYHVN